MKKKTLQILAISMACSMMVGCTSTPSVTETEVPSETVESTEVPSETVESTEVTETEETTDASFEDALRTYLEQGDFKDANYMVSPTSLRAALCLATEGADGQTRQELLDAMGFADVEEMRTWYGQVDSRIEQFADELAESKRQYQEQDEDSFYDVMYSGEPDGAFHLANSVWHNTKFEGTLSEEYLKLLNDTYGAVAKDVAQGEITDAVNAWVKEETEGMIPKLSDDLSESDLILANALYLRDSWTEAFEEGATKEDTFTTAKGEQVQKDFMEKTDKLLYYEDGDAKLVVLPMTGGLRAVFTLGEIDNLKDALSKAERTRVNVKLPKMDLDTSFTNKELVNFLKKRGVDLAFKDDGSADFSVMCQDKPLYIDDILQKTRIKTDEDGLEAAAVTAIIMMEATAMEGEPDEVRVFHADKPFRFYICTDLEDSENEVLFCGQMAQ